MKRVLADIQSGRFVSRFVLDNRAGQPELKAARKQAAAHPIEQVGSGIARNDAVDRQEQAGRQGEELNASDSPGAHDASACVRSFASSRLGRAVSRPGVPTSNHSP